MRLNGVPYEKTLMEKQIGISIYRFMYKNQHYILHVHIYRCHKFTFSVAVSYFAQYITIKTSFTIHVTIHSQSIHST